MDQAVGWLGFPVRRAMLAGVDERQPAEAQGHRQDQAPPRQPMIVSVTGAPIFWMPMTRAGNAHLTDDQQHHLEQLLETLLADWPRTLDHSCQMCRLCDLSACPADRCPVEQRYQHFANNEP
jgi:hypothetical protein